MTDAPAPPLDASAIVALLDRGGPLARHVKGFEKREAQEQMLLNIIDTYNNSAITLIEAGTGTGKSLAYLLPAMLWALATKERTLISTNTITLQEQLLHKDIPLLQETLSLPIKAVLVKGMGNYVCIRKLKEALRELTASDRHEQGELESLAAWEFHTDDGSRSDLSFTPRGSTWEKVAAESDSCTREQCPYYQECYFFKARKQASDAQLLIANHSLLFSDLAYRMENDSSLLPDYQRVILDEAHNIEDTATEHLAVKVSSLQLLKTLKRLLADRSGGKLPLLSDYLRTHFGTQRNAKVDALNQRLKLILPSMKEEIVQQLNTTFDHFLHFLEGHTIQSESSDNKLRILQNHLADPDWKEALVPATQALITLIDRFITTLSGLTGEIAELDDDAFNEKTQGIRADINALGERLAFINAALAAFIPEQLPDNQVHWIESHKSSHNITLVAATLNIAPLLAQQLFTAFPSVILCSATLTTNRTFSFIRERLGITTDYLGDQTMVTEHRYCSPFQFEKQSLLAIPTDLPAPTAPNFHNAAIAKIWDAITASRGNAFVLFTSYSMLHQCYEALEKRLKEQRYHPMKQGDSARQLLLQQFKETDRSVLFGTDSFWEGVDISGEALRCVIIVKLPFKVPTEPIIQARTESITAAGGSAFIDYALPQAIMKFTQGFGRLIRSGHDRGCIVCLDNRLINKGYGSFFLNSLPPCPKVIGKGEVIHKKMVAFYQTSYRFVAEAAEVLPLTAKEVR